MTFLSSPSHIFFPLTTHCFPNDNRVHLANRKKRKEEEKETRKREQSEKGLQKETIFSQFYLNSLREKGSEWLYTLRTISFSSPFVYTSCVSGRGQFHPALSLHPGASFWLRTSVSPLRKWDTERRRRKRDQEESTLFSLFFPPWSCEKKVLFLAEGFLFVWSFCEGKDTECQKIISLQGKTVQPDFFSNPVQIHSNGEQGCCSLFFPPPPPPPLSLITRPQRKAPPFYSPQKGRGETCASVSAASSLLFRRRRPSPLHTNATLCPSFRGRGNRSPWRQIPKFEQFIYICIQVLKKLPKT